MLGERDSVKKQNLVEIAVLNTLDRGTGENAVGGAGCYTLGAAALRRYCSMLEHFSDVDTLIDAVYKLQ